MTRILLLVLGACATVTFALILLVALPGYSLSRGKVKTDVKPYTESEERGRKVYIANGCVYCHSQQIRDPAITVDTRRGWGKRPSYPSDYAHDTPALLGTMRTGPDLINVGARLPSADWHLIHLYQPRALVPWSVMPPFPFLFVEKDTAEAGDTVVNVPKEFAPLAALVTSDEYGAPLPPKNLA